MLFTQLLYHLTIVFSGYIFANWFRGYSWKYNGTIHRFISENNQTQKTNEQKFNDVVALTIKSMIIFYLGLVVKNTMSITTMPITTMPITTMSITTMPIITQVSTNTVLLDVLYQACFFGMIATFGLLGEVSFLKVSLSIDSMKHYWTKKTWTFMTSMAILVVILLACNIYQAVISGVIIEYILTFVILIGYHFLLFRLYLTEIANLHLHHAFLFYILSVFAMFDTPISKMSQALAMAIFVQGTATWGNADIYQLK